MYAGIYGLLHAPVSTLMFNLANQFQYTCIREIRYRSIHFLVTSAGLPALTTASIGYLRTSTWTMFLVFVLLLVSLPDSSQEDCHCQNGCTSFPGSPCQGTSCQTGWFGSYCQKRNIARGQSTWQSSILQGHGYASSDKAVDGNTDQTFEDKSCTHTDDKTSSGADWLVNFTTTLEIRRMRIYLRNGYTDRNVGLQVKVGDQLCYTLSEDNRQQTVLNITCGEALNGSSVTISVDGPYLTLCEVQIFQCSDGWFGDDCDKQCQCQNTAEVCDKETGNCRNGCAAGKHGPGCQQECNNGLFGSDCNKQCQCLTASEACNKETGHCSSGCSAGKQGPGCQQDCGQYHYGIQCSSTCGQCSGSSDCKKDDGTCTQGCQQGYSPPFCKMCAVHFYGPPCQGCGHCKDDSPCSVLNGACPTGCKPGYEPLLCNTACIAGRYGEDCLHTCGHCQINGSCDTQTGRCESNCQPGYIGPLCIQECADYTYGINCSGVCSCLNQSEVCDKVTGECRTGHQSTTIAAVKAPEAQQGQGHEDIRLIVVSCLLAISCVYAVITTANNYRIRRSMKILKAEQMQKYSTLQVRGESSVYDVIAETNVYANESIQDQDPNEN
ncbi:multiple epidermal growth factor-like domains protein 10 [Haliotis rufescens]|uniref:multiple epidermal growth factor-like domains protein 10 n=1 Tax=Haliotis rufescens TaxID=6454 RepID=UPI00201F6B7D|nr:multiple epidermal growth factor-like domains protein 10 [Haliotis rufescens]